MQQSILSKYHFYDNICIFQLVNFHHQYQMNTISKTQNKVQKTQSVSTTLPKMEYEIWI